MKYDKYGRELPDPTPLELPLGYARPEPLADLIRRLIRTDAYREAMDKGMETFEEADDFDVEDDDIPSTPYEADEMQEGWMPNDPPPAQVSETQHPPSSSKEAPQAPLSERVASGAGGARGASEPPAAPQAPNATQ